MNIAYLPVIYSGGPMNGKHQVIIPSTDAEFFLDSPEGMITAMYHRTEWYHKINNDSIHSEVRIFEFVGLKGENNV